MFSFQLLQVPNFPIKRALQSIVDQSDGKLKFINEAGAAERFNLEGMAIESDSDDLATPVAAPPGPKLSSRLASSRSQQAEQAPLRASSVRPDPRGPIPSEGQPHQGAGNEELFQLGAGLAVHGQKHIWDNISGDMLDKLQHFRP